MNSKKVVLVVFIFLMGFMLMWYKDFSDLENLVANNQMRIEEQEEEIESLKQDIKKMKDNNNNLNNQVNDFVDLKNNFEDQFKGLIFYINDLRKFLYDGVLTEENSEFDNSTVITPYSKGYYTVKTDVGSLLISIDNIEEYLNGIRMKFCIGNPNYVRLDGLSLEIQAVFEDETTSDEIMECKVPNNFKAGSWTKFDIVFNEIDVEEICYFVIKVEIDGLGLN